MRRSRLSDAFRRLEGGAATFSLEAKDFNPTLSGLRVKTVIVQALDASEKGVAGLRFVLEKEEAPFTLDRTTGATGFSEDVDRELPVLDAAARFPLLGSWRLRLPDPGQFQKLGDLVLFFAYEVQKPGGSSRHSRDRLRSFQGQPVVVPHR
jgi:hypothetical protein